MKSFFVNIVALFPEYSKSNAIIDKAFLHYNHKLKIMPPKPPPKAVPTKEVVPKGNDIRQPLGFHKRIYHY